MSDAIKALATNMVDRKRAETDPYILFLGAGASISSGCSSMMQIVDDVLQSQDSTQFNNWQREIEEAASKDAEYGELLKEKISKQKRGRFFEIWSGLDRDSQYSILRRHLWECKSPSDGYNDLAHIIKAGYIKMVLSTNLDNLLEKALNNIGRYQPDDFIVFVNGKDRPEEVHEQLESSRTPFKSLPKNKVAKFIRRTFIYISMDDHTQYASWLKALSGADEVQARRFAAAKALELGWGGITKVVKLTGMSHTTIRKGIRELQSPDELKPPNRLRKPGGGRKKIEIKDPKIVEDLETIMDENTAGDPTSLLKWTNKSTYKIAEELNRRGHQIDPDTAGRLLKSGGFSLQANVKTKEGGKAPERDAQFRYINEQAKKFTAQGDPVISVDAKKKENVGEFKNPGRTWRKARQPVEVNVYDFASLGVGKAIPYGIYDVNRNEGMVNVGISYDTSEFAVESIRRWWLMFGRDHYPTAGGLLICADGGGSNGSRRRGWKFYLQELSDQIGIPITVCHYPPGTSKWNKIEHCMFSFISMNWRGQPLVSYETVIKLIGGTTTNKGLSVAAHIDEREYEKGIKFSDDDMAQLQLRPHSLHPKWNYSILSRDVSVHETS